MAPDRWTLTDVHVIDVDTGQVTSPRDVAVADGRVVAVATPGSIERQGEAIDGRGRYVLPGLVDAHVHLYGDADLEAYVAHGVTTVQNMWGLEGWVTRLGFPRTLDLIAGVDGGGFGPTIVSAGPVLEGEPTTTPLMAPLTTPAAAGAEVARQAAMGYDFVKTYDALSRDVFDAIAREAAVRGLPVKGHVPREVGIGVALAAGMTQIEHMTGLIDTDAAARLVDEAALAPLLDTLVARDVAVCPTLVVYRRVVPPGQTAAFSRLPGRERLGWITRGVEWLGARSMRENVDGPLEGYAARVARVQDDVLGRLHAAGVRLVAGTDAGNPYVYPGASLHEELALMHAAGLPIEAVLRSATTDAYRALGLVDRGRVRAGAVADFVVLDENPLESLVHLGSMSAVSLRGRYLRSPQGSGPLRSSAAEDDTSS